MTETLGNPSFRALKNKCLFQSKNKHLFFTEIDMSFSEMSFVIRSDMD
jgi:hypothetical protein